MRVRRWLRAERAKNLYVLRRVREMIFASDHMRDFHFKVVDHVDEMKNTCAVRTASRHVGVRCRIAEIEVDLAWNQIINDHVLARRTKSQCTLVLENVTGG